ncbi:hypothetical protein RN001_001310 [Aquatica leii]|uniref:Ig-like domain-containing protein n=1 Tax=Aquatica leii TaxID=1421715 RepID=A0AAN7PFV9_9COLE|nr:hypothetical protein RN001_001310 [Aquatica leii]
MHLACYFRKFYYVSVHRVIIVNILCGLFLCTTFADLQTDSAKIDHAVEAVLGGIAYLPCDITPPEPRDKMHILIWYKDSTPIYTFDSRGKKLEQGRHWSIDALTERAFFKFQDDVAKLSLNNVKNTDEGSYQCRVDFRRSPTRNIAVNLTVIMPPDKLYILNEHGTAMPNHVLGPYNEGDSVNISCIAIGGRPLPKVTWWQENALLDGSYDYLSERKIRNVLHLTHLERKHLLSVFTCQASNNNLIAPISKSITLDMNLRPLWVKLLGTNKPLSADNTYELTCEVVGSRPSPTITWWKGGIQITDTRETTSPDTNTTTSVLTFTPSPEDGGKFLSCRGQQPLIINSALEDGWKLEVYHIPVVTLELGSNLNALTIREGSDVYFECNIKSNPWVYKVSWKHNGKMIFNNGVSGTIVSNQSLVLQSVNRAKAGTYTCIGSNREGDGESNAVQLDVKYIPACKLGHGNVYNVARQETIVISCEVEANPTNVKFSWKFNHSDNDSLMLDVPQNLITTNKTKSLLSYTPMNERDYGTLLCRGANKIGQQRDPCVFYINPAGKPDPLSNCTVINQTMNSIQVQCIEGFNGGLQQMFILEVYDIYLNILITNVSTKDPEFFVRGLNSDTKLNLIIYAVNRKGRSEIRSLQTYTIKSTENIISTTNVFLQWIPILGALVGVVITLILTATIIVIIIRLRGGDEEDKCYDATSVTASGSGYLDESSKNTSSIALRTGVNDSINSLEEKNPDIIPLNNVDEEQEQEERDFEYLTNMQSRTYVRLPAPNQLDEEECIKQSGIEKIKTQIPHVFHNIQPDAYLQPFNSTTTLQRMQYQLPSYIPRRARESHNEYVTAATPLISIEQNNLQPLLVPNTQRTATLNSQTHIVTRF